jgi:hypothetical protein
MSSSSTERVRAWRIANPEQARAIWDAQYVREGDVIRRRAKEWSDKNPERRKEIKVEYDNRRRTDQLMWAKHMISAIRSRAAKKSIPFDLTVDDLLQLIPSDGACPALGIPIVFGGRLTPNSPSVDRVDPTLGYICCNVAVISQRANVMKQDATDPEELRRVADYMAERLPASRAGSVLDRDHNAARNILGCGLASLVGGTPPIAGRNSGLQAGE